MRKWLFLGVAATMGFIGCSKETSTYYFQINSDTQWAGEYAAVGSSQPTPIEGEGNDRIDITHAPPVCLEASKLVADGYLEVIAYKHVSKKGGLFHSDNEEDIKQDSQRTTEPAGTAEACTQ